MSAAFGFRKLSIADGPDRNKVIVTAERVVLGLREFKFDDVSVTIDLAAKGEDGLDFGTKVNNAWYQFGLTTDVSGNEVRGLAVKDGSAIKFPPGKTAFELCHFGRVNGSGDLYRISNAPDDDWFFYKEALFAGDFLALNGGTATVFTAVPGLTAFLPPGCRRALFMGDARRTAVGPQGLHIRETGSGVTLDAGARVMHGNSKQVGNRFIARVSTAQAMEYALENAGTGFINGVAYELKR